MRVMFTKEYKDPDTGRVRRPGELLEVPDNVAESLIADEYAVERSSGDPALETKDEEDEEGEA